MAPAASRCSQAPRTARGCPAPGAGALARHRPRQGPAYPRPPPLARQRARKRRLKLSRDSGRTGGVVTRLHALARARAPARMGHGGRVKGERRPGQGWGAAACTPGASAELCGTPGALLQLVRFVSESSVRACGLGASVPFLAREQPCPGSLGASLGAGALALGPVITGSCLWQTCRNSSFLVVVLCRAPQVPLLATHGCLVQVRCFCKGNRLGFFFLFLEHHVTISGFIVS